MAWEREKRGWDKVEGRFFRASVDKSGVHDGDTLYRATIELPDNNADGSVDDFIEVDGKMTPVPDAWKKGSKFARFDPQKGTVYMTNSTIRMAGYNAWEMSFSPEGEHAKQALIKMFQGGWVDEEVKDRFRFVVKGVGNLYDGSENPYVGPFQRIVTDIYMVEDGKEKKVGEVVIKNPVDDLIKGKHGVKWTKQNRQKPQNVYERGANTPKVSLKTPKPIPKEQYDGIIEDARINKVSKDKMIQSLKKQGFDTADFQRYWDSK